MDKAWLWAVLVVLVLAGLVWLVLEEDPVRWRLPDGWFGARK